MTEREELAAEFVLGLLEGQDLLTARGLLATDPAFTASVAEWEARFAPLFDGIAPVEPKPRVWQSIEAALGETRAPEVVALRRRVRNWQIGSGVAAALAAVLAIVAVLPRGGPPQAPAARVVQPSPVPLAAAMAPKGGGSFSLVYRPDKRELVAIAPGMPAVPGRDMELWVIPAGGTPLPLGLVQPRGTRRLPIVPSIAGRLTAGATLAVSLEPVGGSPTGLPTGPVLATATILPT